MTKPPNLIYQKYDEDNPDLDKRFKPKDSCLNCKHCIIYDENDVYGAYNDNVNRTHPLSFKFLGRSSDIMRDHNQEAIKDKYDLQCSEAVICEKHNYIVRDGDDENNHEQKYPLCEDHPSDKYIEPESEEIYCESCGTKLYNDICKLCNIENINIIKTKQTKGPFDGKILSTEKSYKTKTIYLEPKIKQYNGNNNKKSWAWVIICLVIIAGIGGLISIPNQNNEQTQQVVIPETKIDCSPRYYEFKNQKTIDFGPASHWNSPEKYNIKQDNSYPRDIYVWNISIIVEYDPEIRKIGDTYYGTKLKIQWDKISNIFIDSYYADSTVSYNFNGVRLICDNNYHQIIDVTISLVCLNITYYEWGFIG